MTISNQDPQSGLRRNGRSNDPVFEDSELLYYRVTDWQGSGLNVRMPDFSVNRGKYSLPAWALYPRWPNLGVISFTAGHARQRIEYDDTDAKTRGLVSFDVEHQPNDKADPDENFAHSAVKGWKNGEYHEKLKIPKTVSSTYRQFLAEHSTLEIPPGGSHQVGGLTGFIASDPK